VPSVLFLQKYVDDRYANTVALTFCEIEDLLDRQLNLLARTFLFERVSA
jgi:hypothetical protein